MVFEGDLESFFYPVFVRTVDVGFRRRTPSTGRGTDAYNVLCGVVEDGVAGFDKLHVLPVLRDTSSRSGRGWGPHDSVDRGAASVALIHPPCSRHVTRIHVHDAKVVPRDMILE